MVVVVEFVMVILNITVTCLYGMFHATINGYGLNITFTSVVCPSSYRIYQSSFSFSSPSVHISLVYLYPLTNPVWESLTEAKSPAVIALRVNDTHKPPSPRHIMDYEGWYSLLQVQLLEATDTMDKFWYLRRRICFYCVVYKTGFCLFRRLKYISMYVCAALFVTHSHATETDSTRRDLSAYL